MVTMFHLNMNDMAVNNCVNLEQATSHLLSLENGGSIPRTPEILNSLIAMTNPLDSYHFLDNNHKQFANINKPGQSIDSSSSSSAISKDSLSSPISVQHTCSQLIKAGLKLSIESKLKSSYPQLQPQPQPEVQPQFQSQLQHLVQSPMHTELNEPHLLDLDSLRNSLKGRRGRKAIKKVIEYNSEEDCTTSCYDSSTQSPFQGLTPDDEERRRRRRERNKIAATKCRLKKREQTVNLVHESEILETQNIDLKTQIQKLEEQRRSLLDVISTHNNSICHLNHRQANNSSNSSSCCSTSSCFSPVLPTMHSGDRELIPETAVRFSDSDSFLHGNHHGNDNDNNNNYRLMNLSSKIFYSLA